VLYASVLSKIIDVVDLFHDDYLTVINKDTYGDLSYTKSPLIGSTYNERSSGFPRKPAAMC